MRLVHTYGKNGKVRLGKILATENILAGKPYEDEPMKEGEKKIHLTFRGPRGDLYYLYARPSELIFATYGSIRLDDMDEETHSLWLLFNKKLKKLKL